MFYFKVRYWIIVYLENSYFDFKFNFHDFKNLVSVFLQLEEQQHIKVLNLGPKIILRIVYIRWEFESQFLYFYKVPFWLYLWCILGFPAGASGKEPACRCKGCGFDPWVGKIPWRGGDGNPSQYSCLLENCMDKGTWWTTVYQITQS